MELNEALLREKSVTFCKYIRWLFDIWLSLIVMLRRLVLATWLSWMARLKLSRQFCSLTLVISRFAEFKIVRKA